MVKQMSKVKVQEMNGNAFVSIPKAIRTVWGAKKGDVVDVRVSGTQLIYERATSAKPAEAVSGSVPAKEVITAAVDKVTQPGIVVEDVPNVMV